MTAKKSTRSWTEFSPEFKAEAVRLWETGAYQSKTQLAKELKMRRTTLTTWLREAAEKTKGDPDAVVVLRKFELANIEAHLEKAINTAQASLSELDPKDKSYFSLQLVDRLLEARKNVVVLPGDFGDGTGIISQEDALKVLAIIPEEARPAFIDALKEVKKV